MVKNRIVKWLPVLLFTLVATATAGEGKLIDLEGRAHALEEYIGNGKWLVVMVWHSECHVCNQEVHEMVALHKMHRDKDATVLGVAIDGVENKKDVAAFISRHAVNFPNLIDDGTVIAEVFAQEVGQLWQGWTPTYLVYSPAGKMLAKNIGAVTREDIETFMAQAGS